MTTLDVSAQEPVNVWLTGAAVVTAHDPGDSDSYLTPAFGGEAPGVVVGIQKPIRPRLRAGYEVGFDAVIEGEQSRRAAFPVFREYFLTTHRDTTVTGLLAWSQREDVRFTPTFVGGVTLAFRHTVRHYATADVALNDLALGFTGGVDVTVRVSQRLFVAPTARIHWLAGRDRQEGGVPKRGVGPFVTRLGVGLGVGL